MLLCKKAPQIMQANPAFLQTEKRRCKKTALKEPRFSAFGKSRLFFMPDRKNNYFG